MYAHASRWTNNPFNSSTRSHSRTICTRECINASCLQLGLESVHIKQFEGEKKNVYYNTHDNNVTCICIEFANKARVLHTRNALRPYTALSQLWQPKARAWEEKDLDSRWTVLEYYLCTLIKSIFSRFNFEVHTSKRVQLCRYKRWNRIYCGYLSTYRVSLIWFAAIHRIPKKK